MRTLLRLFMIYYFFISAEADNPEAKAVTKFIRDKKFNRVNIPVKVLDNWDRYHPPIKIVPIRDQEYNTESDLILWGNYNEDPSVSQIVSITTAPATTYQEYPISKQPPVLYSYYHIGQKLWYAPLYFSCAFVIYVGYLLIKLIGVQKKKIFNQRVT